MEGLAAFFLESTFLGLWLFGWDKLPRLIPAARRARLPDLDLLRIPPPRQQAAIPGITGAEYATGSPPPGSNTRCRSAVSRRQNLTPHQYGRKLTWQPIKLTRW